MKEIKTWLPHLLIRIGAFLLLFGIIYFIAQNITSEFLISAGRLRMSLFGEAIMMALVLMAETILLFAKKKIPKALSNLMVILLIVMCVILIAPRLLY